jgi:superfamily II DNA or RNA helicase
MNSNKYIITKCGCVIEKNNFSDNEINWIKSDLTVRPSSTFISNNFFNVYVENENQLFLPKFYALEKFSIPSIVDNNSGDNIDNINFLLELRDEQKKIISPILNAYKTNGGGILSLPCGFGKTIMALYFVAQLKKKTLIIVHREFLTKHWHDKITECLKDVNVKIIRSTDTKLPECDIAICMLQTLSIKEFPNGYFDSFGHIIIDEVHRVSTTIFSTIFFKINSNYMLGLSATPERKDNMTKVIKWHIGNIINVKCVKHIININVKRFVLNTNIGKALNNKESIFSNKITKLLDDDNRNKIIVSVIMDELRDCPERHFLVLSDRVDHLKKLKIIINNNGFSSVGLFIGEMNVENLEMSKKCKIILGTYSIANEGLDIPSLNCIVLASPKNEVFQTVGRISRLQELQENKKSTIPLIIDFIDIIPVFITESEKRLSLYTKHKYNITDYIYNENKKAFIKNETKDRNYNIYLMGEKITENKHITKNDSLIDNLFNEFHKH